MLFDCLENLNINNCGNLSSLELFNKQNKITESNSNGNILGNKYNNINNKNVYSDGDLIMELDNYPYTNNLNSYNNINFNNSIPKIVQKNTNNLYNIDMYKITNDSPSSSNINYKSKKRKYDELEEDITNIDSPTYSCNIKKLKKMSLEDEGSSSTFQEQSYSKFTYNNMQLD
jgi:hypothetical protein